MNTYSYELEQCETVSTFDRSVYIINDFLKSSTHILSLVSVHWIEFCPSSTEHTAERRWINGFKDQLKKLQALKSSILDVVILCFEILQWFWNKTLWMSLVYLLSQRSLMRLSAATVISLSIISFPSSESKKRWHQVSCFKTCPVVRQHKIYLCTCTFLYRYICRHSNHLSLPWILLAFSFPVSIPG